MRILGTEIKRKKVTISDLENSYSRLREKAEANLSFYVLVILASLICSFGFIMNSPSIIIGAMVISPLIYPITLLGSAIYLNKVGKFKVLTDSLFAGVLLALITGALVAMINPFEYNSEIQSRIATFPIYYIIVAILSGVAGTFSYYWPGISESITGVAISVALIPPIVMTGVALGNLDVELFSRSLLISVVNIVGIALGSAATTGLLWNSARKSKI